MKNDTLSSVGKTIKRLRKERNKSLKEIAEKSNVTAGLLSKIENFRTMPSLPVLQNISIALEVNLFELVREVKSENEIAYILIRKNEGENEERDDSNGVNYEVLFSDSIPNSYLRTVLVTVHPGIYREKIVTDCWESDYIISGEVEYELADEKIILKEGDFIYYNGNFPHSMKNNLDVETKILVNYYMINA